MDIVGLEKFKFQGQKKEIKIKGNYRVGVC